MSLLRGITKLASASLDLLASPLAIDSIRTPRLMEGTIREAVHRLKYNNLRAIAPTLGRLLADFLDSQQVPGQVLVPVPLHPRRERQRGYNQANLLTKEAGGKLGIPVVPRILSRLSNTPPQAKSPGAQERRANVQGSFRCLHPFLANGLEVILLDDVCTTGATLEACALALKEAGSASVWGVTLAREARGLSKVRGDFGFRYYTSESCINFQGKLLEGNHNFK